MNESQEFRNMSSDSIGKSILSALVSEIKLLPDPWPKLSKANQDDIIDRLRKCVETNVKMAVHLLAAEGRTVVAGDLDKITIKDGVKAVVKFGSGAANLHELFDVAGKAVLVVVAHAEAHIYRQNDGGGMDDDDIVNAEFDGYQAAADGKPESDCPIIRSELVIEWIKGFKAWHNEQAGQQEAA